MWSVRGTLLSICICVNCLGANCNPTCTTDFVDVGDNTCMIAIVGNASYCDTHKQCEDEGKRRGLRLFVPGLNSRKARPEFNQYTALPTSVTALLNYSSIDLYAGWRVGDPGYASYVTSGKNSFISSTNAFFVMINERHAMLLGEMFVGTLTQRIYPATVCEKSEESVNNNMEQFVQNWPYPVAEAFLPDRTTKGCYDSSTKSTLLNCARRCKLRDSCRAFYFNAKNSVCVYSLFVDSLLPNSAHITSGTWIRFGRPNW